MNKNNISILFLAFILVLNLLSGCTVKEKPQSNINTPVSSNKTDGVVTNVVDGDTIDVNMDGHVERIRLILVDTPETVHPTKDEQPYGKEASAFTKKTLLKKEVNVELDKQKRDKYDRLLAYIFLDDGTNYNKLLLKKGLAKVAVFPPNVKYIDEFKSAEATAKRDKIGIWSDLQ